MRFAKEKIRCNVICPGSITTDMAAGINTWYNGYENDGCYVSS